MLTANAIIQVKDMGSLQSDISFQKSWHIHVPGIKLIDFASDHHSFVTYDKEGVLRLFNQNGQELWHRNPGYDLVCVSLADTLEVLAADSEKHSILFGPEGATLWRKRPFPAALAKICATGESFAFITTDPAIIGADRSLRVKWAYRNLMKKPVDLVVSANAATTSFACADDRGEGLASVNQSGKPYDAFMGIDGIVALDLAADGNVAVILATHGRVYCLNVVKSFGIWKTALEETFDGISLAGATGESLVYSYSGHVVKLDDQGKPVWDHRFADRLLKVSITTDGSGIFYVTERGEIGLLTQGSGQIANRVVFQEIQVKPVPSSLQAAFKKVWQVELAGASDHRSEVYSWKGQDGVEYCLVWDGVDNLMCLNDLGEEIWKDRLTGESVLSMSVSSEADTAAVVTRNGLIGFDLSGSEIFKIFGQFKQLHIFNEASILILDVQGRGRFYQSSDHFSHNIDSGELVRQLYPIGDSCLLRTDQNLILVDNSGEIVNRFSAGAMISCVSVALNSDAILCGCEDGKIIVFDLYLKEIFSYSLDFPVTLLGYHREHETIFAGSRDEHITVIRRRSGELMKNSLAGRPVFITHHELGTIIGTDLDQLGLINTDGQILARYTSPYRLKKLLPCHRRMSMIVLADEALTCIAAVAGGA